LKFWTYLLRRLILAIPVILGITLITFSISWEANQGDMSRAYISAKMTAAQVQAVKEAHGFDKPFFVQYLTYLRGLVNGDLGISHTQNDRLITQVFADFFPATLELTLVAVVIALVGGVFLGTLSATQKDKPVDHATRFLALAGVSVPIFWLGLLMKFAFATSFPQDIVERASAVGKTVFLFLALLVPVGIGFFAAEAMQPRALSWNRIFGRLSVLGVVGGLIFFFGWSFVFAVFVSSVIVAFALAALVKVRGWSRIPKRIVWAILGGTLLVSAIVAFSGVGSIVVHDIFELVPRLPLGGRMSNEILNPPEAHPSVTHGRTGLLLVDTALAGDWVAFNDVAQHLVLPAITLGYFSLAIIARIMRASMLEILSLDFVRTARAKGIPEREVIRRHARRNALIPIATVVGLTFGGLLGGAVLTETIFQWPGLGRWSTQAIGSGDAQSIMAFTLFVVIVYLIANLIVDLLYSLLDPRVRLS